MAQSQPASLSLSASSVYQGQCYTLTAGNGANMKLDVRYIFNGGPEQVIIGWPTLDGNGQKYICTDSLTALGAYVYTGIRNTDTVDPSFWLNVNASVSVIEPPPQPTSLSFSASQGYAGSDCFTMTVGGAANKTVDIEYSIDDNPQPAWSILLNSSGQWSTCLNHNNALGKWTFTAIKNHLHWQWVSISPVVYTVLPAQPTSFQVSPSSITAGTGNMTMTAGNAANITLDIQYTINNGPVQITYSWPAMLPIDGGVDGRADQLVSTCNIPGNYRFTAVRNQKNTAWFEVKPPASITVLPPPTPTVTALSVGSGARGSDVTVTINGTNLCGVSLSTTWPGLSFSNITQDPEIDGNAVLATFNISSTASVGTVPVTVSASGGSTTLTFVITNNLAPTITAITPSSGSRGSSVVVTITGNNLASSTLSTSTSGVTFSNVSATPAGTSLTATFNISSTAALGNPTIQITNSVGSATTTLFSVTAAALTLSPSTPAREYIYLGARLLAVDTAPAVSPPSTPSTPINVGATAQSTSQITVNWTDTSTNEDSFKVYWNLDGGPNYTVETAAANTTQFVHTGLTPGRTYFYRIGAHSNSAGDSPMSAFVNAATSANLQPPGAPTNISAAAQSSSQISISWTDTSNNEDGFKIRWNLDGGSNYNVVTVGSNTTLYVHTGLTASTRYYYRVSAYNNSGESAMSGLVNATTSAGVQPPSAPTNVSAAAQSSSQITISWTDTSNNEDGFKIHWNLDGGSNYTIVTVGPNTTSYVRTGLTASTRYYYRVSAYNTPGDSALSGFVSATTSAGVQPPTAPTGVSAVAQSSSQITVSWTDASNNEDGFKIHWNLDGGSNYTVVTVGPNTSSYVHTGLTASTTYYYRVSAYNSGGDSPMSGLVSATTSGDVQPPGAPTNVSAGAQSSSQITISWTDTSNNEDGFKIHWNLDGGSNYTVVAVRPNTTSYVHTGLNASTTYHYRVSAYNSAGAAMSGLVNATTSADVQPPTAPTNVTASAQSSSQSTISWTDTSANEDGFKIRWNLDGGSNYTIVTVGPNTSSYVHTGLTAATTYHYRVSAYNSAGDSALSGLVNATTTPQLPNAPTNVSAAAQSSSQITISWTDTGNNEDGFKIRWNADGGSNYTVVTVGPNTTSYVHTGLAASTTYYYRVSAFNSVGESAMSDLANSTTSASGSGSLSSPTNLTATSMAPAQVSLTWLSDGVGVDHYQIERASTINGYQSIGNSTSLSYTDNSASAGAIYLYRVRAVSGSGNTSNPSNIDLATTIAFVDDPLTAGMTIMAQHVTQLRDAVNALRIAAGLGSVIWTDPSLNNQVLIKAVHILELRTRLNEALTALGLSIPNYTDPVLNVRLTAIKKAHIEELRQRVK